MIAIRPKHRPKITKLESPPSRLDSIAVTSFQNSFVYLNPNPRSKAVEGVKRRDQRESVKKRKQRQEREREMEEVAMAAINAATRWLDRTTPPTTASTSSPVTPLLKSSSSLWLAPLPPLRCCLPAPSERRCGRRRRRSRGRGRGARRRTRRTRCGGRRCSGSPPSPARAGACSARPGPTPPRATTCSARSTSRASPPATAPRSSTASSPTPATPSTSSDAFAAASTRECKLGFCFLYVRCRLWLGSRRPCYIFSS
jgi:hypothetical protein